MELKKQIKNKLIEILIRIKLIKNKLRINNQIKLINKN